MKEKNERNISRTISSDLAPTNLATASHNCFSTFINCAVQRTFKKSAKQMYNRPDTQGQSGITVGSNQP